MLITRQLYKQLSVTMLCVFAVLMSIISTAVFSRLLNEVASGEMTLLVVVKLMAVQFVIWTGYFLPQCFYIALLIVLAKWYKEQQITILHASGVSRGRLLRLVIFYSSLVMALSIVFNFFFVPFATKAKHIIQSNIIQQLSLQKMMTKNFTTIPGEATVYIGSKKNWYSMPHDVYTFQKKMTKNGSYHWTIIIGDTLSEYNKSTDSTRYFRYQHGWLDRILFSPLKVSLTQFKTMAISPSQSVSSLVDRVEYWPFTTLWLASKHSRLALGELCWRFFMPFSVLVLSFWSFSLSYTPPRKNRAWVFLPAILLFAVYFQFLYMIHKSSFFSHFSPVTPYILCHSGALVVGLCLWAINFGLPLGQSFGRRGANRA